MNVDDNYVNYCFTGQKEELLATSTMIQGGVCMCVGEQQLDYAFICAANCKTTGELGLETNTEQHFKFRISYEATNLISFFRILIWSYKTRKGNPNFDVQFWRLSFRFEFCFFLSLSLSPLGTGFAMSIVLFTNCYRFSGRDFESSTTAVPALAETR